MGSLVQKVLQRRIGQEGIGIGVIERLNLRKAARRTLLPFLLVLSYAGMVSDFSSSRPVIWFLFTVAISLVYSYICFKKEGKAYVFETLTSYSLLMAGGIQHLGLNWLHLLYAPFLIVISRFYGRKTAILLSLVAVFLEIRHFIYGDIINEASFILASVLTGAVAALIVSGLKEERDRLKIRLDDIREKAENFDCSMDTVGDDSTIAQYYSSALKANEEMKEVLLIIKELVSAESACVFVRQNEYLEMRCSSDASDDPEAYNNSVLMSCLRKKETVLSNISSLMAVPIIDGTYVIGVLAARSPNARRFSSADMKTLEIFSPQLSAVFRRERIYAQINIENQTQKILQDGSERLVTSLKIESVVEKLIEVLQKVTSANMVFFMPKGDKYEIIRHVGFETSKDRTFDFKNTIIGMIHKNREPVHLSDLRDNSMEAFPFDTKKVLSLSFFPLIYEKNLLGMLVLFSGKVNAISSRQIAVIKTLVNQATTSLANAKLYSEIERMSVTDGLTGLFNHRHFQDRLSEEFKRLQRTRKPFSLMLIDIDFFKKINDTYGHPAGDEVLRKVSAIVRHTIRDIDIPARYGGEEFAAVLLDTDNEGAKNMAERLRKAVAEKTFTVDDTKLKVTISIGIATAVVDASNKEGLIEKADQALYHAKKSGRNRSVLYREIG